jgi:CheY-like chemotaxis protein
MNVAPRVLCVDDEPEVLAGLQLNLRRKFQLLTADSGEEALRMLDRDGPFAVVMSDMRMPRMDGAALLTRVRERWPTTTRVLLTGHADMPAAVAAVNDGQIFRFLTKPCPPERLLGALSDAAAHHQLVESERVLLEQTLKGSIDALSDVLALMAPELFGRSARLRELAGRVGRACGLSRVWALEVAASMLHLGLMTLPPDLAQRALDREPLSPADRAAVERGSTFGARVLSRLPRLEPVREVLRLFHAGQRQRVEAEHPESQLAAKILAAVTEFEGLERRGHSLQVALGSMRAREVYEPRIIEALSELLDETERLEVAEVPLAALRVGMHFVEDVRFTTGLLLVPRGYAVNATFLERVSNLGRGAVREPVKVSFRPG